MLGAGSERNSKEKSERGWRTKKRVREREREREREEEERERKRERERGSRSLPDAIAIFTEGREAVANPHRSVCLVDCTSATHLDRVNLVLSLLLCFGPFASLYFPHEKLWTRSRAGGGRGGGDEVKERERERGRERERVNYCRRVLSLVQVLLHFFLFI